MTRPTIKRTRSASLAGAVAILLLPLLGAPARAQFSWFGSSEASPQDVADTIAEHGFRLVGPLYRNGRVYVANVIDRRSRRERLVVSAESGQIVQRFLVDAGPDRRAFVERPRASPRDESFFSHLTRGWDDEPPPRPPLALPNQPDANPDQPAVLVPRARPRTEPRVVTRTDVAPVSAAPLPPVPRAEPAERKPDAPAAPAQAGPARATTVVSDPLKIPGVRKAEPAKPAAAANAVATAKAPEAPLPKPAPTKPVEAPPKPADVPVAPLD